MEDSAQPVGIVPIPYGEQTTKVKRHLNLLFLVFAVVLGVSMFYFFYSNTTLFNGTVVKPSIFLESGLPQDYQWSVTYANINSTSKDNQISFAQGNGQYAYKINTLQNSSNGCTTTYTPRSENGSAPGGLTVKIIFYGSTNCTTILSESGISTGYPIKVMINGKATTLVAGSIKTIFVAPGNVQISANVSGLNCSASGTFNAGSNYSISNWSCNTVFYEAGLPKNVTWQETFFPDSGGYATKSAYSGSSISFSSSATTGDYYGATVYYNNKGCEGVLTPSNSQGAFPPGSTNLINFSGSLTCITTFVESGLPSDGYITTNSNGHTSTTYELEVNWGIIYDGQAQSVGYSPATFSTGQGNYSFSVQSVSVSLDGCTTTYTPSVNGGILQAGIQENITFFKSSSCQPVTRYDEQIGMTFTNDFTSLGYYVTATPQSDSNGYGPAYFLNGLTNNGYWYQIGLSYNWPYTSGEQGEYSQGFNANYEVFSPSGQTIDPSNGGSGILQFSGTVNSGDYILLSLGFNNGNVVMSAEDVNTSAYASATFSAYDADEFVGDSSNSMNSNGFFTGLMTEWYHVNEYYSEENLVKYTPSGSPDSPAWLWADEKTNVFFDSTNSYITPSPNYTFIYDNATCTYYSNGEFTTGS